jgi:hypothetical protein
VRVLSLLLLGFLAAAAVIVFFFATCYGVLSRM